jgi:hypothetical protein
MYSKGISWIDDCRIPFVDDGDKNERVSQEKSRKSSHIRDGFMNTIVIPQIEQIGRFPANILVCDDMLNDGSVSKSGSNRKNTKYSPSKSQVVYFGGGNKDSEPKDSGSSSRYYDIDKWFNNLIDG